MVDMSEYQTRLARETHLAQVTLAGLRHVLVPTSVVSRELPRVLTELTSPEAAGLVMYQLGYLTGAAHAERFFEDRGIGPEEPLYRTLTGPFHFAWAGYGDVNILLIEPHQDERFVALWETGNSFSAREGMAAGERRRACYTEAGYSAGWVSTAMQLPLATQELACRTEGVRFCRFLIADAQRMRSRLAEIRFHQPRETYRAVSARMPGQESGAGDACSGGSLVPFPPQGRLGSL